MKLTNLHIAVSSFAAIAGVAIAAYQAFAPAPASQQPVQVTLALDPQQAATAGDAVKTDGGPMLQTASVALEKNAHVAAAYKDGSETRYAFASLFDGKPETSITILPPENEVNVVMEFQSTSAQPVTAIEYMPPPGITPDRLATKLDVMVLPEGQMSASGLPVISFAG